MAVSTGPAVGAEAGDRGQVATGDLIRILSAGQPANLSGMLVEGDLDLGSIEKVGRPLRCQECRFTGKVTATDLIFERIVDFSGSIFDGPVDMSAALFRDRAGFEGVQFKQAVTFGSTRFLADASFAQTEFGGATIFDRTQFGAGAQFSDASFVSDAGFQAAQFAAGADFADSEFGGASNFASASFGRRVSFARSQFTRIAEFRGAVFPAGANLGVEKFSEGFSLEAVNAGGSLDFLGAVLQGEGVFNNLSSTGLLNLDGIRVLAPDSAIFLDQLSVARLTMDVERIGDVRGRNVQKSVLKLVEKSGRESGDLALANRARFQLLELEGEEKEGFARLADRLLFRDVSGYLVRPLHPVVTLLILVLAGGMVRSARSLRTGAVGWWRNRNSRRASANMGDRMHEALLLTEKAVSRVLAGLSKAMNVAVRRKPDHIKLEDPDRVRDYLKVGLLWAEFLIYKLVFAVFLLALGNSNSTVRQLLDAVTG